jgi:hypothetical protein
MSHSLLNCRTPKPKCDIGSQGSKIMIFPVWLVHSVSKQMLLKGGSSIMVFTVQKRFLSVVWTSVSQALRSAVQLEESPKLKMNTLKP